MKTNEIITGLRRLSCGGSQYRRTVCRLAADRLRKLEHRCAELEHVRTEQEKELRHVSACFTCGNNGTKCHTEKPITEPTVCCGSYVWRGRKKDGN